MIPYGKQNIIKEDIKSVTDVMKSDFLTQGPITPIFENALSKYCNSKYSVAVINATSGLHLACLALNVGKGDLVWTSPISFVASSNAALYCGAEVDFVDIDNRTYNMCTISLEKKLINAKKINKLPKVVIPVHLSGQSCDMKKIHKLSMEYGFKIIEDASHAVGAKYLNHFVGSCKYSDITVFSFHPVKIITTCEGGACLTNDETLFNRIYKLRSHGIVRNQDEMKNTSHGPWYYEQTDLGYNYRLNDLQSALGLNQLKRVNEFIAKRHEIADYYNQLFKNDSNILTPFQDSKSYSSYHLYIIRIQNRDGSYRKNVFEKLRNEGIYVNIHYIPIYRQPYYSKHFNHNDFPNSEKYYSEAISLPIFPTLTKKQINHIYNVIKEPTNFQNLF